MSPLSEFRASDTDIHVGVDHAFLTQTSESDRALPRGRGVHSVRRS